MFDRDFDLKGKHAQITKHLVNTGGVFRRYIDVYMVGAIVGFIHNRKAERDISIAEDATIFAAAFNTERMRLEFFYQLIMLLDESTGLGENQRIDRAFRVTDANPESLKENMDLFHSYVYGGIEVLFEKMAKGCTTIDDYIDQIYEVAEGFQVDVDGVSYDELIEKEMNVQ